MRLRPDEWPEPTRGLLTISHMPATICASRRTLREVRLLGEWVTHPISLMFMFDPEFVDVVGDGFLLRGHVIASDQGRTYEHEQLWLVRPCGAADGPPLARFDARRWMKQLPVEERTSNEPSVSEQWHKTHVKP